MSAASTQPTRPRRATESARTRTRHWRRTTEPEAPGSGATATATGLSLRVPRHPPVPRLMSQPRDPKRGVHRSQEGMRPLVQNVHHVLSLQSYRTNRTNHPRLDATRFTRSGPRNPGVVTRTASGSCGSHIVSRTPGQIGILTTPPGATAHSRSNRSPPGWPGPRATRARCPSGCRQRCRARPPCGRPPGAA